MTQEQALEKAKDLLPNISQYLRLERERSIGKHFGSDNEYRLWEHSPAHSCEILASSVISFEDLLRLVQPESMRVPVDEPVTDDDPEPQFEPFPTAQAPEPYPEGSVAAVAPGIITV